MKNLDHNPNAKPMPANKDDVVQYLQGRGAQINTKNRFLINERTKEHIEAIDEWTEKMQKRYTSSKMRKL
jgi:hypothetical protein